jgi:cytochrome c553
MADMVTQASSLTGSSRLASLESSRDGDLEIVMINPNLTKLLLTASLAGCVSGSPQRREMQTHYQRVGEVQSALIHGNLSPAQDAARWLAEHDEEAGLPEAGTPWLTAMRAEARGVAAATAIEPASSAAGRMAKVCGDCHRAVSRGPRIVVPERPSEGPSAMGSHAVQHQWAADRLWDGLIGPSDSSWNVGARDLAQQPIYQADVGMRTGHFLQAEEMAQRVVELGRRAGTTQDGYERAAIYGEFLASCASCHRMVGLPQR